MHFAVKWICQLKLDLEAKHQTIHKYHNKGLFQQQMIVKLQSKLAVSGRVPAPAPAPATQFLLQLFRVHINVTVFTISDQTLHQILDTIHPGRNDDEPHQHRLARPTGHQTLTCNCSWQLRKLANFRLQSTRYTGPGVSFIMGTLYPWRLTGILYFHHIQAVVHCNEYL